MKRADLVLGAIALGGPAAVGAAYYTQHAWNMQPCPWCVLQRVIFLALAAAALLALVWRSALGRRIGALLALVFAGCGIGAALWQHFVAASQASCDLSLAEKIVGALGLDARYPDLFMAMTSCADAATRLFGVPYEFWSLALFALAGLGAITVMAQPRR
ncbi:disulfide bond formation protein B [Rubrivivax gelatinosus]|uniref:Disulfide bond formation protein B n=1 Tax=Rubrivivax gelatinosus TaxID=28068 RepID=A0ABS1DTD0_RUBGE|nr:disulfide bond formation protein B [Rubrivivax gelatinosus]MBK1613992.1 disulfide bond formation protein B [Rubrivivax gelatinosus]MBK1712855.1 disulfide bond formation protein B [Rubrivivax gelatinosus]